MNLRRITSTNFTNGKVSTTVSVNGELPENIELTLDDLFRKASRGISAACIPTLNRLYKMVASDVTRQLDDLEETVASDDAVTTTASTTVQVEVLGTSFELVVSATIGCAVDPTLLEAILANCVGTEFVMEAVQVISGNAISAGEKALRRESLRSQVQALIDEGPSAIFGGHPGGGIVSALDALFGGGHGDHSGGRLDLGSLHDLGGVFGRGVDFDDEGGSEGHTNTDDLSDESVGAGVGASDESTDRTA